MKYYFQKICIGLFYFLCAIGYHGAPLILYLDSGLNPKYAILVYIVSLFLGIYSLIWIEDEKEDERYNLILLKKEEFKKEKAFLKLIYETNYSNYKKIRNISLDDTDMSKINFFFDNNINYKIEINNLLWIKNQDDILKIDNYLDTLNTNSLEDYKKAFQHESILKAIINKE